MATLSLRWGSREAHLSSQAHSTRTHHVGCMPTTPRRGFQLNRSRTLALRAASRPAFEAFDTRFQLPGDLREKLGGDLHEVYNLDFDAEKFDAPEGYEAALPTYWVPMGSQPRCFVEQIVAEIFSWHVKRLGLDESALVNPDQAGSEWWTLHLDGAKDDVEFHWDVDGGVRHLGEIRHPFLGTVTYIEAGGSAAPTAIVEGCHKAPVLDSGEGTVRAVHLSAPLPGKHICFDGRQLHGAPAELRACFPGEPGRGARVTLLVNLWLDSKPGDAQPLPDAVAARLAPPHQQASGILGDESCPGPSEVAEVAVAAEEAEWESWAFEEATDEDHELVLELPVPGPASSSVQRSASSSVTLRFEGEAVGTIQSQRAWLGAQGVAVVE
eukprot:CAMPEP_0118928722 /NCGR_PEP_ID=MMETSP1169-20130426/5908_1 /TAXON_ID=36882 /ORGANISM="Pyramimonas obovata, Strain CCMP722" /LENGTH=381 /DNA_ID=CAMNT_0006870767 /DNA_START=134 /DNA_END=1279 /DNA_ORIENTATION=-